ncbi:hypothetical protein LCGC14_2711170, partial [marine sediment metagenome]
MIGIGATKYLADHMPVYNQACDLVASLPEYDKEGRDVRCHEVVRALRLYLENDVRTQDGHYGIVEHSWFWLSSKPLIIRAGGLVPPILDVYSVGRVPMVQLVDTALTLPHNGYLFVPGEPREDIRWEVVLE